MGYRILRDYNLGPLRLRKKTQLYPNIINIMEQYEELNENELVFHQYRTPLQYVGPLGQFLDHDFSGALDLLNAYEFSRSYTPRFIPFKDT